MHNTAAYLHYIKYTYTINDNTTMILKHTPLYITIIFY